MVPKSISDFLNAIIALGPYFCLHGQEIERVRLPAVLETSTSILINLEHAGVGVNHEKEAG